MKYTVSDLRNILEMDTCTCYIRNKVFKDNFYKTNEKIEFTFNGWDGKSYDGETRKAYILKTNLEGFEDCEFVKVGKNLHIINRNRQVIEKSTGIPHATVAWVVCVAQRKTKATYNLTVNDALEKKIENEGKYYFREVCWKRHLNSEELNKLDDSIEKVYLTSWASKDFYNDLFKKTKFNRLEKETIDIYSNEVEGLDRDTFINLYGVEPWIVTEVKCNVLVK